jgi:DNA mismatch repair protein MutS
MKLLATDEQTMTDLGIFGKSDGRGIFNLYNRTKTRGGEDVLKNMFLHPLADEEEINRRSALINQFSQRGLSFPFDVTLFDIAEKYLLHAEGHGRSRQSQHVLGEKEIQNGVLAMITIMQELRRFLELPEVAGIDAYRREKGSIDRLLSDPVFEPVGYEKPKHRLPYTAIAAYDLLFRTQEHGKIKQLLEHIYYLDVYLSVAKMAVECKWSFARAVTVLPTADGHGSHLRLEGVYHPELSNAIRNTVAMDAGQNVIFLTGANMAGKSTFLRSVSSAMYVAHVGLPVAAGVMEFSVLDGLYTTINLPDNLGIGASHFYNEVLRVKKVAAELEKGRALLVVFDELFRGTNVKDANEGTVAITAAFAGRRNSLFIISSHIVEAGESLRQCPTIGFQYLPTRMDGHQPVYTYRLEQGITDDRHGMIIIRNEGILDILANGVKQ